MAVANFLDKNECDPSPCDDGGICIDGVDSFYCECKSGFEGPTCSSGDSIYTHAHPLIKCISSACLVHMVLFFSVDINECIDIGPCLNNANCTNTPGSYFCSCSEGYRGDNCSGGVQLNLV